MLLYTSWSPYLPYNGIILKDGLSLGRSQMGLEHYQVLHNLFFMLVTINQPQSKMMMKRSQIKFNYHSMENHLPNFS